MDETKKLVRNITLGIQEKKGTGITVVDMSNISSRVCRFFVICQGNSSNQVDAIAESVGEKAFEKSGAKPFAVSGLQNSSWVAMDYGDVIVHIFQPEEREFYDLEHLWADAKLTKVSDVQ